MPVHLDFIKAFQFCTAAVSHCGLDDVVQTGGIAGLSDIFKKTRGAVNQLIRMTAVKNAGIIDHCVRG